MGKRIFKSTIFRSRRTGVYNINTGLKTKQIKFNAVRFPCNYITYARFNSGARGGAVD
jgi:hypothetical protein